MNNDQATERGMREDEIGDLKFGEVAVYKVVS
jgi:hypothetical protein